MRLNNLAGLLLGIGVFASCSPTSAASAENEYVVVTCGTQGVVDIIPVDVDFHIITRGVSSPPFEANIGVVAKTPWKLLMPADGKMELEIGEYGVYKVEDESGVEDDVEGRIYVHDYYIKSDQENGAKVITVKAGTSVRYTAYKNGGKCASDWTVNGESKGNTSSIIFNRNWWNVPAWLIPSMDTPKPGVYGIHAHDVDLPFLEDSGNMTVVGVKNIAGGGKVSEKDDPDGLTDAETVVTKKNANVSLTAFPEPNVAWPQDTPAWSASCGFWCLLGDHFIGDTEGQPSVTVNASDPDVIVVTSKCGASQKCIKVIVYDLDLAISKTDLTLKHDSDTELTVTAEPSSATATPTVQIKRNDIGAAAWPDWMNLLDGRGSINWKGRVAGTFKLRAKARIAGEEFFSPERDLTVEFPVFDQIIADDNVKAGMLSEWEATLNDCTLFPTNRLRERGFWVFLDTAGDNAYSCGNSIPGDWFLGPFVPIVSVDLGARPGPNLSDVAPNASGANYAVSSFHAHPPTTYLTNNLAGVPSQPDMNCDYSDNVTGIVYDYVTTPVPPGHPKDSPAEAKMSRNQRDISRE